MIKNVFLAMASIISRFRFHSFSIFDGLKDEELELLNENLVRKTVKQGEVIFHENTLSSGLYIVEEGKVKISQTNLAGKEQIAYIYGEKELMGYRPLLCDEPHAATATALEDGVLLYLPATIFLSLLERSTVLARKLLHNLSHEFSVWIHRVSVLGQLPVKKRTMISLLILNEKYARDGQKAAGADIPISREDLASFVGTTIETVVRMLRELKDEGVIETQGRIIRILKPEGLERIFDNNQA